MRICTNNLPVGVYILVKMKISKADIKLPFLKNCCACFYFKLICPLSRVQKSTKLKRMSLTAKRRAGIYNVIHVSNYQEENGYGCGRKGDST